MKKLVFMFFLTLLSTSSYAEILKLKCTYKSIDEKFDPGFEVGDATFYNYDLNSPQYVVTYDFIRHYLVSKLKDSYYIAYIEIYRYSGELIYKAVEIPKEEIEELLKSNILKQQLVKQDKETFVTIKGLVFQWFFKNKFSKDLSWIEYKLDCEKAKKQF